MFEYVNITVLQKNPVIIRSNVNHKEYILMSTYTHLRGDDGRKHKHKIYFFSSHDRNPEFYHKENDFPEGYRLGINKIGAPYIEERK